MRVVRLFAVFVVFLILLVPSYAQVSKRISAINAPRAEQSSSVPISIELVPTANINRALIRYRSFGVTEFTEVEMLQAGRSASATIPAEAVQPPYLQYYFVIEMQDGTTETFPEAAPDLNPLQLSVTQVDPREREVRFLSPDQGETVALEEFVLAISLYYASPAVAPARTRIFFDDADVSKEAILSDDVILWAPRNSSVPITLGAHSVRVELRDTLGNLYYTRERSFSLSTTEALAEEAARLQFNGDVRSEYRNEQTANPQTFARLETRASGTYSFLTFGTNLRLDNLESGRRQPQNRYLFYADAEYVRLEVGDAYPRFPSLMMLGKRVRGVTGALRLGFFNIDVSVGRTERMIEGAWIQDTTFADTNSVRNRPNNTLPKYPGTTDDSLYRAFELFSVGTYSRDFIGIHPSFGSGENFRWGFTYLKFKDDMSSIHYGILPKENFVAGTDILFAFDDDHIRWETQIAVGLKNSDITGGNFTDADYDSLKKQGNDVKALGKIAENFITVNGNLEPLNPTGKGLPGMAMESYLTMNYLSNYIRAQFVRRGTSYSTFGNEFQQSDIQGIAVSDNIRLLSNRLFASISYESKGDNLSDTKTGTTKYGNLSTAVTYAHGAGYPTIQLGYGLNSRLNDQFIRPPGITDSLRSFRDSSGAADDAATRYTLGMSYDIPGSIRNFVTLSFNTVNRDDKTIYRRDQKSMYLQGSVSTFFKIPFQTTVSFSTSQTSSFNQFFYSASGADSAVYYTDSLLTELKFNYTSVSLGAQYRMMNDALRLTAQIAPTFGDVNRTAIRFGGDYTYRAHVFELLLDIYQNSGIKDDTIMSFVYRYNF